LPVTSDVNDAEPAQIFRLEGAEGFDGEGAVGAALDAVEEFVNGAEVSVERGLEKKVGDELGVVFAGSLREGLGEPFTQDIGQGALL
jgi:hypothetical protein